MNDLSTICAGIDAGSRAIKIVLIESPGLRVIDSICADQGVHQDALATRLLDDLLARNSLSRLDLAHVVATGYARNIISLAHTTITEITCHACGVSHVVPGARTVVEIGGQDSKLLCLQEDGSVRDFAMNDRCAAGTGRFLEIVAQRLEVPLDQLGPLAATSTAPAAISSMCVVFAETEIIGLLASGISEADIVAGVQLSIAQRVAALAGGKVQAPVVFTGGVALLSGMDQALAKALDRPVTIAPTPQMTGALGAAILAARQMQK